MHIVFQFPIIDYRPLLPDNGSRLAYPGWPSPGLSNKPFIRHFGAVKARAAGGNTDFAGEAYFCDAHLSLRYKDLQQQGPPITAGRRASIHHSYRRFFSDGYFVSKVEAGFVDNTETQVQAAGLTATGIDLQALLNHYATLPVTVGGKDIPLYKAGSLLTQNYYSASTKKGAATGDWKQAVASGEVCVMAVYAAGCGMMLPEHAFALQTFPLQDGKVATLYGYKLRTDGYRLKVWLLELPYPERQAPKPDAELLRNLRVYILRIHLEKETMRLLLNAIRNGPVHLTENSPQARLANAYFEKAGEKLFKQQRFQLPVQNLIDYALHSEEVVDPGSFSTLQEGVFYFQDQYTRERIEKALTGMQKKKVLFICASPRDKNPLDFGREYRAILDALQVSIDRQNYEQDLYPSVKKSEFLGILLDKRPDYLHISMHSSLKQGLCFEDETGKLAPMSVEEFAAAIRSFVRQYQLSAVVLSACNSKGHAQSIKALCRQAIGTSDVFPAEAGIVYADGFYTDLFTGKDIATCHGSGQAAIRTNQPPFAPVNAVAVDALIQLV